MEDTTNPTVPAEIIHDPPAAGSFRASAPSSPPARSDEDRMIDKIVDRLQARLGLAASGSTVAAPEPGGPCKYCGATGLNPAAPGNPGAGVSCVGCYGTGEVPGRRLS
jgi:hypothetical protein